MSSETLFETERVRVVLADHVATVTLTRGDKHNALDGEMFQGLIGAVEAVGSAHGARVVVLHGDGPSFCSGLDIASLMGGQGPVSMDDMLERGSHKANLAQRVATDWIDLPVPVIAALHGNVFGGGLQIALGADIRFATPDAVLSIMESKWGLVPDMGITSTLPRLVPIDVAKELTFTARRLSGTEAAELGLVTHVAADAHAAAAELAAEIAGRSPDAIRAAKQLFDATWNSPVEDGLVLETDLQKGLLGSKNQMAAVTAGFTKQPAEFEDPQPVAG